MRWRLRPSSPALARRTKASAICATMKVWRRRRAARVVVPPRFSVCSVAARRARRLYQTIGAASTTPRTRAATSPTAANRWSKRMLAPNGSWADQSTRRRSIPSEPRRRPSDAPTSVRSSVSARTSEATWRCPAPSAWRTARSFVRPLARMSSRLVRLTMPIRSRNAPPACRRSRIGRMVRTWSAWRPATVVWKPASLTNWATGSSTSSRALNASSCDWASAMVAPGARRAIIWCPLEWR